MGIVSERGSWDALPGMAGFRFAVTGAEDVLGRLKGTWWSDVVPDGEGSLRQGGVCLLQELVPVPYGRQCGQPGGILEQRW